METWVGNSEQSELYTICIEGDYRIRAISEPPVVDSGTVRSDYGGPVVPVSAIGKTGARTVGNLPPIRRIAIFQMTLI